MKQLCIKQYIKGNSYYLKVFTDSFLSLSAIDIRLALFLHGLREWAKSEHLTRKADGQHNIIFIQVVNATNIN